MQKVFNRLLFLVQTDLTMTADATNVSMYTSAICFKLKNQVCSVQQEMGGYFIINGIEKVLRMLIMQRRNYPIVLCRPKWKSRGQGYTQYGR